MAREARETWAQQWQADSVDLFSDNLAALAETKQRTLATRQSMPTVTVNTLRQTAAKFKNTTAIGPDHVSFTMALPDDFLEPLAEVVSMNVRWAAFRNNCSRCC